MPAKINIVGLTFGKLKVTGEAPRKTYACGGSNSRSVCLCECGTEVTILNGSLRSGHTQSCGCLQRERTSKRSTTHGHTFGRTRTRNYRIWQNMKSRCTNPRDKNYERYGGRGIAVCKRWESFESFHEDMGDCPPGLTIDRIDNNGNYEPTNCRWATQKQQQRNRRDNLLVTFMGITACLSQQCERFGKDERAVWKRLRRGWSIEKALFAALRVTKLTQKGKSEG